MLRPQLCHSESIPATLLFSHKSLFFGHGNSSSSIPIRPRTSTTLQRIKGGGNRYNLSPNTIRAQVGAATEQSIAVKAVVTVQLTVDGLLTNLGIERGLDDITDLMGKTLNLELVASHLNSLSEEKKVKGYAHRSSQASDEVKYECTFQVPASFGEVGAVLVQNEHHKEMYLKNIVLDRFPNGPVTITCNSWVASKFDNPAMRIFFTSKCYLPSQTPSGLKKLREADLVSLRGNGEGEGERKTFDRIYDYDKYNDLGDPDKSEDLARPVLGGPEHPYPRRCRTGRGPTKKDPKSEQRSSTVYVPRDEAFSEVKELTFATKTLKSVLHALLPALETAAINSDLGFPHFTAIDTLFNEGVPIPATNKGIFKAVLPRLVKALVDEEDDLLLFETPAIIGRDKFSWFRDEEFSRQTLAGLNPYSIQLVTEWPLKSKLDPKVYGPPESAITSELIEKEIKGCMTVDEALKNKKLFIIDYHDLLLPYVQKVRGLEGTTLYGSRILFFLTEDGTLRPLAIELTRPPMDGKPQWKQVFSPGWDSTSSWLWKFAKAHATCHDAGYHQLVIHWLRTHCCMEPYIIAGNRQLSAMHPIYRLLHPHFRYTMEINALAREALINADGIIESCFAPGKYSIELSSAAYDQLWRFDLEALPADLIRRGMAVEDPTAEHGVKLTIEDYPFANDGLVLWDAIKSWVTDYVSHYYPEAELIKSDSELQAWWSDVRNKGHADKKDEPWWPELNNQDDLVQILSTIIWVASGHHAAVNFGQYPYAGYFPNRPTVIRTNMPSEDPDEKTYKHFLDKPEISLLQSFPSQIQATKVMSVLDVLSSHSPDEEYLGELSEPSWSEDPVIKAAFERFSGKLQELDGIIDARNADLKLLNRTGAGVVPYQLLKPSSKPGVTGMGVPTSISI